MHCSHVVSFTSAVTLAFLATSPLTVSPAGAHQAPTGWTYPWACCSNLNCQEVDAKAISEKLQGYVIQSTGEGVAYGDTLLLTIGGSLLRISGEGLSVEALESARPTDDVRVLPAGARRADKARQFNSIPSAHPHVLTDTPAGDRPPAPAGNLSNSQPTSSPGANMAGGVTPPTSPAAISLRECPILRPHCQNPTLRAGSAKNHCHSCRKAMGESEAA